MYLNYDNIMFAIHTFICIVTYDILVGPETDHFAVPDVDFVIKQVNPIIAHAYSHYIISLYRVII